MNAKNGMQGQPAVVKSATGAKVCEERGDPMRQKYVKR